MIRVVLDTNVLVSAMRSNAGAPFQVIEQVGPEAAFRPSISVPLVLEYEMALRRRTDLSDSDVEAVIDYLCQVCDHRRIHYLWRPTLRDPRDEMVLEVAVESGAELIVTHNVRDFAEVEGQFGVEVIRPGAFLERLKEVDRA